MDSFYGGPIGRSFIIKRTFSSINEMEGTLDASSSDYYSWWIGEYCLINTNNTNHPDNGKLFMRENEFSAKYICSLIGPSGRYPDLIMENGINIEAPTYAAAKAPQVVTYWDGSSYDTKVLSEDVILGNYYFTTVTIDDEIIPLNQYYTKNSEGIFFLSESVQESSENYIQLNDEKVTVLLSEEEEQPYYFKRDSSGSYYVYYIIDGSSLPANVIRCNGNGYVVTTDISTLNKKHRIYEDSTEATEYYKIPSNESTSNYEDIVVLFENRDDISQYCSIIDSETVTDDKFKIVHTLNNTLPEGATWVTDKEYIDDTITTIPIIPREAIMVPGKDGETYNDGIKWAWYTIAEQDETLNTTISTAHIGFEIPYPVFDFEQDMNGLSYNPISGDAYAGSVTKHPEEEEEEDHPFYHKYDINLSLSNRGFQLQNVRLVRNDDTLFPTGHAYKNSELFDFIDDFKYYSANTKLVTVTPEENYTYFATTTEQTDYIPAGYVTQIAENTYQVISSDVTNKLYLYKKGSSLPEESVTLVLDDENNFNYGWYPSAKKYVLDSDNKWKWIPSTPSTPHPWDDKVAIYVGDFVTYSKNAETPEKYLVYIGNKDVDYDIMPSGVVLNETDIFEKEGSINWTGITDPVNIRDTQVLLSYTLQINQSKWQYYVSNTVPSGGTYIACKRQSTFPFSYYPSVDEPTHYLIPENEWQSGTPQAIIYNVRPEGSTIYYDPIFFLLTSESTTDEVFKAKKISNDLGYTYDENGPLYAYTRTATSEIADNPNVYWDGQKLVLICQYTGGQIRAKYDNGIAYGKEITGLNITDANEALDFIRQTGIEKNNDYTGTIIKVFDIVKKTVDEQTGTTTYDCDFLIIYNTKDGVTRTLARTIHNGVPGTPWEFISTNDYDITGPGNENQLLRLLNPYGIHLTTFSTENVKGSAW